MTEARCVLHRGLRKKERKDLMHGGEGGRIGGGADLRHRRDGSG
eukprot:CAMPEP_0196734414 /NCGR_PEP_ID=MMETSP1091-20130531/13168_1 /TAXON_ID=302021 /ORGANISM="Rhodomonas sp., Strain CCMP768" /LENGTH=43 /DNA_ID= /DNA_START= /DNA_END= /DNA_ORIENTATION=